MMYSIVLNLRTILSSKGLVTTMGDRVIHIGSTLRYICSGSICVGLSQRTIYHFSTNVY
jgi:hypothetical protein